MSRSNPVVLLQGLKPDLLDLSNAAEPALQAAFEQGASREAYQALVETCKNAIVGGEDDGDFFGEGPTARAVFEFNRSMLLIALKAQGVADVRYVYSGEGDSGGMEEITFFDAEGEPIEDSLTDHRVLFAQFVPGWQSSTRPEKSSEAQLVLNEMDLEGAAIELLDSVINLTGHAGYENNEGGHGVVTLFVEDGENEAGEAFEAGQIHIEHQTVYTTTETSEDTL